MPRRQDRRGPGEDHPRLLVGPLTDLIAVNVGNGLIVWHTPEEWAAFKQGTDREAIEGMAADLEVEERDDAHRPA